VENKSFLAGGEIKKSGEFIFKKKNWSERETKKSRVVFDTDQKERVGNKGSFRDKKCWKVDRRRGEVYSD